MQYENTLNYSASKNYAIGRIITNEERNHCIRLKNRKYNKLKFLTIILGIITFAMIAVTIIFRLKGNLTNQKISETFLLVAGIFFVVVLLSFLITVTPHKSITDRLRYENLRVEDVIIQNINRTSYRSGRYVRYHYYYTCKSDNGRVFVKDSSEQYHVRKGGRALVVHMSEDGNKPVIYTPIKR